MNPMPTMLTACAIALFATASVAAHSYRAGAIEIDHPWTRPAPAGATGGGFLVIKNTGATPVTLISATTPAARSVSLHRTTVTNGVARMSALSGGLPVAPGATVALAPGGYHLMLEGLTAPLVAGGRAPLTLNFSGGVTVRVDLNVEARPTSPASHHGGH